MFVVVLYALSKFIRAGSQHLRFWKWMNTGALTCRYGAQSKYNQQRHWWACTCAVWLESLLVAHILFENAHIMYENIFHKVLPNSSLQSMLEDLQAIRSCTPVQKHWWGKRFTSELYWAARVAQGECCFVILCNLLLNVATVVLSKWAFL